jgi:hypothetical protein
MGTEKEALQTPSRLGAAGVVFGSIVPLGNSLPLEEE